MKFKMNFKAFSKVNKAEKELKSDYCRCSNWMEYNEHLDSFTVMLTDQVALVIIATFERNIALETNKKI